MRLQFGKAKHSKEDLEREAAEELKAAVERARPPTEKERTWDQPPPSVPDLRAVAAEQDVPADRAADSEEAPEAQSAAGRPALVSAASPGRKATRRASAGHPAAGAKRPSAVGRLSRSGKSGGQPGRS